VCTGWCVELRSDISLLRLGWKEVWHLFEKFIESIVIVYLNILVNADRKLE
jgi:hypothetical protein